MTPFETMVIGYCALSSVWAGTTAVAIMLWRRVRAVKDRLNNVIDEHQRGEKHSSKREQVLRQVTHRLTESSDVIRLLEATVADTSRLLTDAQGTIATLEARLTLPEPTPADLVLLDAAVRPERLTDAPVAVPEGCRVEVMRYRPHAVLRGPRGRFVRLQAAEQDNAERAL